MNSGFSFKLRKKKTSSSDYGQYIFSQNVRSDRMYTGKPRRRPPNTTHILQPLSVSIILWLLKAIFSSIATQPGHMNKHQIVKAKSLSVLSYIIDEIYSLARVKGAFTKLFLIRMPQTSQLPETQALYLNQGHFPTPPTTLFSVCGVFCSLREKFLIPGQQSSIFARVSANQ